MFVGHYGVAFVAKAIDPTLPLPALMISTQLLDVAWSTFVLTGVEKVRLKRGFTATNDLDLYYMPFSHGLITAVAWSLVASAAAYFLLGQPLFGAALVGGVCFSHWLLDLLVHVPDLPLVGNRFKVGFGLWNFRIAAFIIEIGVLFAGAAAYYDSFRHVAPTLWQFVVPFSLALFALQAYSVFGPPPVSTKAVASSALVAYLVTAIIAWVGPMLLGIH